MNSTEVTIASILLFGIFIMVLIIIKNGHKKREEKRLQREESTRRSEEYDKKVKKHVNIHVSDPSTRPSNGTMNKETENNNEQSFASATTRGVRSMQLLFSEKYTECYELFANSNIHIRPKDESILCLVCLCLGKYREAINYSNRLLLYTQEQWPSDRIAEKEVLSLATKAEEFMQKTGKWSAKNHCNSRDIMDIKERIAKIYQKNVDKQNQQSIDMRNPESIEALCNELSEAESEYNHYAIAELLFSHAEYSAAATAYLLTIQHNPNNAIYWSYFGQSRMRSTGNSYLPPDFIEAVIASKKAVQLDPNEIKWRINYINVLLKLHMLSIVKCLKEIIKEYEEAIRITNIEQEDKVGLNGLGDVIDDLKKTSLAFRN